MGTPAGGRRRGMNEKIKGIVMFSGGLDSTLAARIILDQGIELYALHLTSPFCTCDNSRQGCRATSIVMAEQLGIPMVTVAKGADYFSMLKHPRYGYGSGINPCIDCRIYSFALAKEEMVKRGARFIVTGEVLGQRPMSQRRHTLELIEKRSGLEGLILRPLSAKHFSPTVPEKEGWVDRDRLLNISGRSRKEQIRLAEDYSLKDYPCPAGGCLLTDKGFAARVRDLFAHGDDHTSRDFTLLKIGRHFRLPTGEKLIVGRNEEENYKLMQVGKGKLTLLFSPTVSGPTVGVANHNSTLPGREIAMVFRRYSKIKEGDYILTLIHLDGRAEEALFTNNEKECPSLLENYLIR